MVRQKNAPLYIYDAGLGEQTRACTSNGTRLTSLDHSKSERVDVSCETVAQQRTSNPHISERVYARMCKHRAGKWAPTRNNTVIKQRSTLVSTRREHGMRVLTKLVCGEEEVGVRIDSSNPSTRRNGSRTPRVPSPGGCCLVGWITARIARRGVWTQV